MYHRHKFIIIDPFKLILQSIDLSKRFIRLKVYNIFKPLTMINIFKLLSLKLVFLFNFYNNSRKAIK